jgi:hypothetical protein
VDQRGEIGEACVAHARSRGDERFLAYAPTTVRQLKRAAARASVRDARLADLAALIHELPESPCAR